MRCWVKFCNECNFFFYLLVSNVGNFKDIVSDKLEEGGDDVKLLWFLWLGLYMCYNGWYKGLLFSDRMLILKS